MLVHARGIDKVREDWNKTNLSLRQIMGKYNLNYPQVYAICIEARDMPASLLEPKLSQLKVGMKPNDIRKVIYYENRSLPR